jgi:Gram-negative bacterial TonB protein C-terminal
MTRGTAALRRAGSCLTAHAADGASPRMNIVSKEFCHLRMPMRRWRNSIVVILSAILIGPTNAHTQQFDSLPVLRGSFAPLDDSSQIMPASHRTAFKGSHAPVRRWYCPPVAYPPELWQLGVPGKVVFRFVVDTFGRPELDDMLTVEASHHGFVPPARRAVSKCRFDPAMSAGRRVRVVVEQGVRFWPDSSKADRR